MNNGEIGVDQAENKLMHAFDVKPEENLQSNLDQSFQENGLFGATGVIISPPFGDASSRFLKRVRVVPAENLRQGGRQLVESDARRSSRRLSQRVQQRRGNQRGTVEIQEDEEVKSSSQMLFRGIFERLENQTSLTIDHEEQKNEVAEKRLSRDEDMALVEQKKARGQSTSSSSLMVYYLIKRFMTVLSVKRRQKLFFKQIHFSILGDTASEKIGSLGELRPSASISGAEKQCLSLCAWLRWCRGLLRGYQWAKAFAVSLVRKAVKPIPLVYPQSVFKIAWDAVLCVVLIYFFVSIPVDAAFNNGLLFRRNFGVSMASICFLFCDYLLKMNTIYYEFGKPVSDRALILARYLKSGFLMDGLAIGALLLGLCFEYLYRSRIVSLCLFVFYSQYNYFSKIIRESEESLNLGKAGLSLLSLCKLILILLFVEHNFSCLWYFVAEYKQSQGENNWLAYRHMENEDWQIKYLESFYFSTVTMLSVGYGDIVPQSRAVGWWGLLQKDSLEKILSIIFMLIACIQLSYSVNTVGEIISALNRAEEECKRRMRVVNRYMNGQRISFGLQYQVREYLKIYWQNELTQESEEEERVLLNLSEGLRNKLILEANSAVLGSCPLFRRCFSAETKVKLLKTMRTVIVNPENVLSSQLPQLGEPALCFLVEGELNVPLNFWIKELERDVEVRIFRPGQYFGLEEFISGSKPEMLLSSQTFVKLVVLARSEFLRILRESPNDYEEFCMLKDEFVLKIKKCDQKCVSCNFVGHNIHNCPLVHFAADREKIIKNFQFIVFQPRNAAFRRNLARSKFLFEKPDCFEVQELQKFVASQGERLSSFYERQAKVSAQMDGQRTSPALADCLWRNNGRRESMQIYEDLVDSQAGGSDLVPQKKMSLQKRRKLWIIVIHWQDLHGRRQGRIRNEAVLKFQAAVRRLIRLLRIQARRGVGIRPGLKALQLWQLRARQFARFYQQFVWEFWQQEAVNLAGMLAPVELEELNFLVKRIRLLSAGCNAVENGFECQKEFLQYLPQNNLVTQLQSLATTASSRGYGARWHNQNPANKSAVIRERILRESLGHYLLFPNEYYARFSSRKPEENAKSQEISSKQTQSSRNLFRKLRLSNRSNRLRQLTNQKLLQLQSIPTETQ